MILYSYVDVVVVNSVMLRLFICFISGDCVSSFVVRMIRVEVMMVSGCFYCLNCMSVVYVVVLVIMFISSINVLKIYIGGG